MKNIKLFTQIFRTIAVLSPLYLFAAENLSLQWIYFVSVGIYICLAFLGASKDIDKFFRGL